MARQGAERQGTAGFGRVSSRVVRQGLLVVRGWVRFGVTRLGKVRQGTAR